MASIRAAILALGIAPLLLAPANAQTATPLTVTLTNFAFTPGTITLKSGTTYTLHLVNNGGSGHNFSAPEFFAASTVAAQDKSKIADGAVEVDEGQSADVTVTPTRAGTYKLICTHFMHQTFGMTGQIVVQ